MTIDFESFTPELLRLHPTEKGSRPGIGAWVAEMDFGVPPAVAEVLRAVVDAGWRPQKRNCYYQCIE